MKTYRPTWIDIDLDALTYNLKQVRSLISSETKILATVKADAYGHGLIPISNCLSKNKIDYLGVATIDEALALKNAEIKPPILILGNIFPNQAEIVVENDFIQTVYTKDVALGLNKSAQKQNKKSRIHIKVDTGMARQGVWHKHCLGFIKELKKLKFLQLEGLFTHFPCAEDNKEFTRRQISYFNKINQDLANLGFRIPLRHCANSAGIIDYKGSHFDLVRPGLMLYGLYPKKNTRLNLKPVLSLKSKVVFIKTVPKDTGISYGHSFITKKDTKIALIPIGYGDGYPRSLSNKAKVLIKGEFAPIIGRVCMDQLIVDISSIKNVKVEDEVVLIGSQQNKIIRSEELANLSNTIAYEIVCGFNSRIPRIYRNA